MKGKRLLTLGIAVFVMTTVVTVRSMEKGNDGDFQLTEADVGKMCLS